MFPVVNRTHKTVYINYLYGYMFSILNLFVTFVIFCLCQMTSFFEVFPNIKKKRMSWQPMIEISIFIFLRDLIACWEISLSCWHYQTMRAGGLRKQHNSCMCIHIETEENDDLAWRDPLTVSHCVKPSRFNKWQTDITWQATSPSVTSPTSDARIFFPSFFPLLFSVFFPSLYPLPLHQFTNM